jgi:hypothetical protein
MSITPSCSIIGKSGVKANRPIPMAAARLKAPASAMISGENSSREGSSVVAGMDAIPVMVRRHLALSRIIDQIAFLNVQYQSR